MAQPRHPGFIIPLYNQIVVGSNQGVVIGQGGRAGCVPGVGRQAAGGVTPHRRRQVESVGGPGQSFRQRHLPHLARRPRTLRPKDGLQPRLVQSGRKERQIREKGGRCRVARRQAAQTGVQRHHHTVLIAALFGRQVGVVQQLFARPAQIRQQRPQLGAIQLARRLDDGARVAIQKLQQLLPLRLCPFHAVGSDAPE